MEIRLFVSVILLLYINYSHATCIESDESEEDCESSYYHDEADKYKIQYGDSQNCPQISLDILEVLPGYGWDNLRNKPMGAILTQNYSHCRVTADRKFLIPNDVNIEAMKESNVHVYSQLISHFSNYTSTTSKTVNVEAHGSLGSLFSASGSFSHNYQTAKMRIYADKSTVSRSQLRFTNYDILSRPDTALDPVFEDRILDIVESVQSGNNDSARYLAELLVRDYGTHIVQYVQAGASIVQEDYLNSTYVKSMDSDKTTIRASAHASFLGGVFGGGASYESVVTHEQVTKYRQSTLDSYTFTHGGPPFRMNFSVNEWIDDMDNNLVTVDRGGEPIYDVITSRVLPYVSLDNLVETASVIEDAVKTYYAHNVYKGCTSMDSPNFSYIANLDDGTCEEPFTNHSFGGLFQTCTGGLCKGEYMQLNPKTGKYACDETQYTPVLLYAHTEHVCIRHCHHHFWGGHSCHDDCRYTDTSSNAGHYESYWCAAKDHVTQSSGYLFGGFYTETVSNPLTNDKNCPDYFVPLRFGFTLPIYVCVSDDDQMGYKFSLPFGGFFTCNTGNPLALKENINSLVQKGVADGPNLMAFTLAAGPVAWPKSCPKGYSQHLVANSDGCEINYCVKTDAFSQKQLPIVKRPPFLNHPRLMHNSTRVFVDNTEHLWLKLGGNSRWQRTQMLATDESRQHILHITNAEPLSPSNKHPVSPAHDGSGTGNDGTGNSTSTGTTIALSVVGTLLVGAVVVAVGSIVVAKKRASREYRGGEGGSGENEALLRQPMQGGTYPAIGDNNDARV